MICIYFGVAPGDQAYYISRTEMPPPGIHNNLVIAKTHAARRKVTLYKTLKIAMRQMAVQFGELVTGMTDKKVEVERMDVDVLQINNDSEMYTEETETDTETEDIDMIVRHSRKFRKTFGGQQWPRFRLIIR